MKKENPPQIGQEKQQETKKKKKGKKGGLCVGYTEWCVGFVENKRKRKRKVFV